MQESQTSESGVPTRGKVVPDRFSSDELFQRIVADADHEVTSGTRELFFSGLAAGFAITITFLLYVSMSATTDSTVAAALLYPLGFIYIIIGGYQLFTENTLPPVALTLERLASIPTLLRHWLIVLAGNFAGGTIGAVVLAYGGVFSPEAAVYAADIAQAGVDTSPWSLFFKAAFAGLIVAGVVWMDFAAQDTISRIVVVYLAFLAIPLGELFHVVVSFTEAVYLMLVADLAVQTAMFGFILPVLLGNTIGGVLLVTVVNYYQTSERRLEVDQFEGVRRLSVREMLLGNLAGRSYVPVLDTVEEFVRDSERYRVLVPISNPRTEAPLVELACRIASEREKGTVHVVHIVQARKELILEAEHGQRDRITAESKRTMADLEATGAEYDVEFETSTIVSPRSFEEIFDRARRTRPNLVVMGWGDDQIWSSARAERPIDELANKLPCDFVIAKDRGLDPSRILLPTAGGPDSTLSAELACTLQASAGADVELLHVVDSADDRDAGERFLEEWAREHNLEGATCTVDDSGNIEAAIKREAADNTLVLIGATEKGLLSRLVSGSLHMQVTSEIDASVLLTERPSDRTFFERLFGRGSRNKIADRRSSGGAGSKFEDGADEIETQP
ncbi:formate transporter [Salinadaptatus halalkaliphilus]|uniref:Formate transporter n=2 Tax=Salinadaptatus halalkaliphilus TaxID=2419781 RepID=A0A4S3TR96_9EURY|nr:formate/nitrite transporter family protein [Salinadaptatus halalkaliphilus]THE66856.1 formate transporter [Salinadaptatus halalkaliphilus]